jgi:ribosomal protein S18 acetylase RimI-like enzyme
MNVRILTEVDAPAWWRLRLESLEGDPYAFGKSAEEHRETTVQAAAARLGNASPGSFNLGAFDGETLVGIVRFARHEGAKERHKGHVYGLYVTPGHRSDGVAKALMAALIERAARESGIEQLLLSVAVSQEAARRLYRSFGFETFGIEPNSLKVGCAYLDEEHMILRVDGTGNRGPGEMR